MKKIISFVLFVSMIILPISSCSSANRLSVSSDDYPKLSHMTAGEFDEEKAMTWFLDNPYSDYTCSVSNKNGELWISNQKLNNRSYIQQFNNGYFFGVDLGDYDGWVKYSPYNTALTGDDFQVVSNENCCGIISKDKQNGYILTGIRSHIIGGDSKGSMYTVTYDDTIKTWQWDKTISFEGFPMAYDFSSENDQFYVVTDKNILRIKNDNTVETVVSSDLIPYIGANSIVCIDDVLYCGTPMGVYSYNMSTQEEKWYPMEYEKYVQ